MTPIGPSRSSGNETRYKYCPACGRAGWTVSMNDDSGAWSCYACEAGGGGMLTTHDALRRSMQPRTVNKWNPVPLPAWEPLSRTARKYLRDRNIHHPEKFGIVETQESTRLLIPYFGEIGQPIYWTTRAYMPDGRPKYVSASGRKPLYVLPRWVPQKMTIIVEGPFDAMAVFNWPGAFGLDTLDETCYNVVALGGKQVTRTVSQDIRRLALGDKIVMLDSDALLNGMKIVSQLTNATIHQLPRGTDPADIVLGET